MFAVIIENRFTAHFSMVDRNRLHSAFQAAIVHLGFSIFVALLTAFLVFGVWYPFPFRGLAGGSVLFGILIVVDLVCGPLLTAVVFNPKKPRRELVADLSLIATIQLLALVYGVYSIGVARPVFVAFEVDRFVAVSASQIDTAELPFAQPSLQSLSWTGPKLIGTRTSKDGPETLLSIELSLRGKEPSVRPGWWQDFELNRAEAIKRMKPLRDLMDNHAPEVRKTIDKVVEKIDVPVGGLFYLPLVSQHSLDDWIVVLDETASIVTYAPVGGF